MKRLLEFLGLKKDIRNVTFEPLPTFFVSHCMYCGKNFDAHIEIYKGERLACIDCVKNGKTEVK